MGPAGHATYEVEYGTTLLDISKQYCADSKTRIALALFNNQMVGLQTKVMEGVVPQGIAQETLAALTSLGYSSQEVLPAIEENVQQCTTVEELLKKVLRVLGSGR